jgi:hypothetical protein
MAVTCQSIAGGNGWIGQYGGEFDVEKTLDL